jgi:hypothetical protein
MHFFVIILFLLITNCNLQKHIINKERVPIGIHIWDDRIKTVFINSSIKFEDIDNCLQEKNISERFHASKLISFDNTSPILFRYEGIKSKGTSVLSTSLSLVTFGLLPTYINNECEAKLSLENTKKNKIYFSNIYKAESFGYMSWFLMPFFFVPMISNSYSFSGMDFNNVQEKLMDKFEDDLVKELNKNPELKKELLGLKNEPIEQGQKVDLVELRKSYLQKKFKVKIENGLIMYEKPSIDSKKITVIPEGKILHSTQVSTEKTNVEDKEDFWILVEYENKTGWVFAGDLQAL